MVKLIKMKAARIVVLAILLSATGISFAAGAKSNELESGAKEPFLFKNNDIVCFVGDSITHGGMYYAYIQLYYVTRYPDRKISVFNCGIMGDRARNVIDRYNRDIKPHNPTVVTIMLGMNDIGRGFYSKRYSKQTGIEKTRERWLRLYEKDMRELIRKIKSHNNPTIILLTPSIYDQTAQLRGESFMGANDALKRCSDFLKEEAVNAGYHLIDFFTPMCLINEREQKKDPTFTLIGKGRVHPGLVGHYVMAYLFLKGQGAPGIVSEMRLDAQNGKIEQEINCQITNVKLLSNGIQFVSLEKSLPMPVDERAKKALELVPIQSELNREMLSVKNLLVGRYALLIDGKLINTYSADELKNGINLALETNTPQYQQSKVILGLILERAGLVRNLIDITFVEGEMVRKKVILDDENAVNEFLSRGANDPKTWWRHLIPRYRRQKPKQKTMESRIKTIDEMIYKKNKPQNHSFIIKLVK